MKIELNSTIDRETAWFLTNPPKLTPHTLRPLPEDTYNLQVTSLGLLREFPGGLQIGPDTKDV